MVSQKKVNDICFQIIGCAIEVNKNLGAGLLESVYQACLIQELRLAGLVVSEQVELPITYKNVLLQKTFRLDILVENLVIVELKSVLYLDPVFSAQLLTYLKISKKPKGLLINFNSNNITKNVVHLVTDSFAELPKI